MSLFRNVGILGSLVLVALTGCSDAAQEASSNEVPVAQQVTLATATTPAYVNSVLQGRYQYTDPNNDREGSTQHAWLRDGQPIEGASQDTYTATQADSGKQLQYRVTPAAATGQSPGATAVSAGISIENSAPTVTLSQLMGVGATSIYTAGVGSELQVDFSYNDVDGDAAATVEIRWLQGANSTPIATGPSYTVASADLGSFLVVEITPVALQGVVRGAAVSSPPVSIINSVPVAKNPVLTGNATPAIVGTVLTANYTYFDADNDPQSGSSIQWLRNGVANGVALVGITAPTYTLTTADGGASFRFTVTPRASSGTSPGVSVTSNTLTAGNSAPRASVVMVNDGAASTVVGATLTASYTYSDLELNPQGVSVYRWYRGTSVIPGATTLKYTVIAADSGKDLIFEVTPVATLGTSPGVAVRSTPVIRVNNSAPLAQNVTLSANTTSPGIGTLLTANYTYFDADGDVQGTSTFRWLRSGATITGATGRNYTLTFSDTGKTLAAEVTPLAQTGTSPGLPVMSNAVAAQPTNVALNAVSAGLKQLRFSWAPVPGASSYKVSTNPDGVSGFVPVSTTSSNIIATTYDWGIGVHRINWPKAQFMLEACDASNFCLQSASVSALSVMVGAIGYFKASNTEAGDWFGYTVALSGDGNTLAIGAFLESSAGIGGNAVDDCAAVIPVNCAKVSGAVYVYSRSGITWSQQAYVKASNPGAGDYFSSSIALSADGNTLAVGAFGEASSINSAPNELAANAGAVYVFTRNASTWTQQAYVKALNTGANDFFGTSVALSNDGNTLAVGANSEASNTTGINSAPNELAYGAGAAYVFTRSAATWIQQAYVKASNVTGNDGFGSSVALSANGNTLAVGASGEDSSTTGINSTPNESSLDTGAVYVFTRNATTSGWLADAYVKASNTGASDYFGTSVALSDDGNTLAVGANYEDSAAIAGNPLNDCSAMTPANCAKDSGAVYVYTRNTTTWLQQAYVKASNTGAGDYFGQSVALSADGNTLAVGAFFEAGSNTGINRAPNELAYAAGAVYVSTRSSAIWTQQAYVKASNTNTYDYFGRSIALSNDGNTLAVGAHPESSAATGVNNTLPGQGDNSAPAAGAVYLY